MDRHKGTFRLLAEKTAEVVGSPTAFFLSIIGVAVWILSGLAVGFGDSWQLVINTLTNLFTLFIVLLIQNTQNRHAKAVHLKLDELIRAVREARTGLVGLEDLSDEELARLEEQFKRIRERESRPQPQSKKRT